MALEYVEYSDLRANPFQPRSRWPIDPGSVRDLADDISANGLIHYPVGRQAEDGTIQIGVGHRRIMAWTIAYPDKPIPIDIRELSDRAMYDYVIAESQHRLDWTALERGERLADYMQRFGVTQTEAAKRFNLTQGAASNLIRLARELPADVKPLVNSRALPERFARQIVTLARIDDKASVKVAQAIAQADDSERERVAQDKVAEFLEHNAESLSDIAWPAEWKPDHSAMIDRQMETPPACQGCPAVETAMQVDYCTRLACFKAKGFLWQQRELNRLSEKFAVQIGIKGESVHALQINWDNESAARALLADKKIARDHLRLMPVESTKNNQAYYHKQLLGSNQAILGSTDKSFAIKRDEPRKVSGASKAAPADETPAQKSAREKREERERQARREEKSALRRAKADVLWLLTHTAERMGPEMKISGGILDYCYDRMHAQGYFTHQDWPEYIAFEDDLLAEIKKSTDDDREALVRSAIILGQLRRDISAYNPETEFDLERATTIVEDCVDDVFRLSLPKGWSDIPIHKTDSNCHLCGKFTPNAAMTGVDKSVGWGVIALSGVSTVVHCPDCKDKAQAMLPTIKTRAAPKPSAKKPVKRGRK